MKDAKKEILSAISSLKNKNLVLKCKDLISKHKNLISVLIIVLITTFMMFPLFSRTYFFGDDTEFHRANIEIIGECIKNGNISRILPNTARNFGYGIDIFYPNLSHFLGGIIYSIISFIGLKSYDALKILHFIAMFFSGISMWIFVKNVFKNYRQAIVASILYITLPYLFVDIYMRDALAESLIFIFMPLIFLGLYYLFYTSNKMKFYVCFIIGYTGMINSHLVITVFFTLCILLYMLVFYKKVFEKKNFNSLFIASILILAISSPFIVGLLQHYARGGYVVTETEYTLDQLWTVHAIEFFMPYYYKSSEYSLINININYINVLLLLFGIIWFIKNYKNCKYIKVILGISVFSFLAIVLASTETIWMYMPKMLRNIQFTWRLAAFVGFGCSCIGSLGIYAIDKKYQKSVIVIISILILISSKMSLNTVKYDKTYQDIGCCDWNNAMGWQKEYLPQKTKDNLEYYEKRDNKLVLLDGNANCSIMEEEKFPNMQINVSEVEENVKIEFPRLYYIGYELYNSSNQKITLEEDDYGYISANITENGIYKLKYTGTIYDNLAKIVFIITIIFCTSYIIIYIFNNKRRKDEEKIKQIANKGI